MADEFEDQVVVALGHALSGTDAPEWKVERRFEPKPAVKWLSPAELIRSGVASLLATTFGQFVDRREAIAAHADQGSTAIHEHPDVRWIDYVADLGDGFDATYAVASMIAQERLSVGSHTTHRGGVLVMGGDEIYPYPDVGLSNETSYHDRTVGPYEAALGFVGRRGPEAADHPHLHLYAIPGNHDWYDGLAAFRKQFLRQGWVGAWKTRQHRSYFALRLADDWWLWGIDTALDGPLDHAQTEYFADVGRSMGSDASVILCLAKPRWYESPAPEQPDSHRSEDPYELVRWFLNETLAVPDEHGVSEPHWTRRVRVMLTGDRHHYARFTECEPPPGASPRVKITAGGGGAFLSLTNDVPETIHIREPEDVATRRRYATMADGEERVWPSRGASRWSLGRSVFGRIWQHGGFVVLLGVVHALLAVALHTRIAAGRTTGATVDQEGASLAGALDAGWTAAWSSWLWWFFAALLLGCALAFAAKGAPHTTAHGRNRGGRVGTALWAVLHTAALTASVVLAVGLSLRAGHAVGTVGYVLAVVVLSPALAMVVHATYLFLSGLARRHANELSVALRHEGWKHFLRLHIADDGDLEIYAIGARVVPRQRPRWRAGEPGHLRLELSGEPVEPELIDRVVVPRR